MGGLLLLGACRPEAAPIIDVVERTPLPAGDYTTLHLDAGGGSWLGAPGRLTRVPSAGTLPADIPLPEVDGTPTFVGEAGGVTFFHSGTHLIAVEGTVPELRAGPVEIEPGRAALDVRGRYLYRTSGAGSIIAHDPVTLEPVWGWGAVGAPAPALALSPEGDLLYLAVVDPEGARPAEILVRDVQTGRILSRVEVVEPIKALVADGRGDLYALAVAPDRGGMVIALRYRRGELETRWRHRTPDVDAEAAAALILAPSGRRLAVLAAGEHPFLEIVDAQSGLALGRYGQPVLDAAFGPADELWVLLPEERWRLE
jgi:hypothetical protein